MNRQTGVRQLAPAFVCAGLISIQAGTPNCDELAGTHFRDAAPVVLSLSRPGIHSVPLAAERGCGGFDDLTFDTPLALASSPIPAGRIVVSNDDWPLTDDGFREPCDPGVFAENVAAWFTGGRSGRFLVYADWMLGGGALANAMTLAGHAWVIDASASFTLANLLTFDGVFLCGVPADNLILRHYVRAGGNVYLAAVGWWEDDLAMWNPFLNAFGLAFTNIATATGDLPITSTHPVFRGVDHLFQWDGTSVVDLQPANASNQIVVNYSGTGLYAVWDGTGSAVSPPVISTQPTSVIVAAGAQATLSASAGGGPGLWFQWYRDGVLVASATNRVLSLPEVSVADTGSYAVVATNELGAATSQVAAVSVITRQPESQTVNEGEDVVFRVEVVGVGPFSFQWYQGASAIGGATDSTLVLTNVLWQASPPSYSVTVRYAEPSPAWSSSRVNYQIILALWPIRLEGWNRDIIVENAPQPYAQPFDSETGNGAGNAWIEAGWSGRTSGLPPSRRFLSREMQAVVFELQPYTSNNSLSWRPPTNLATLRLVEPGRFRRLAILAASSYLWSDSVNGRVTVTFSDGTQRGHFAYASPDWAGSIPRGAWSVTHCAQRSGARWWASEMGCSLTQTIIDLGTAGLADKTVTALTFAGPALDYVPAFTAVFAVSGERAEPGSPPYILDDPKDVTVAVDGSVTLRTLALGSAPLSYQWRFEGTPLPGASSTNLVLANVQPDQVGAYDVMVSNAFGSVTSGVAYVCLPSAPVIVEEPPDTLADFDDMVFLSVKAVGAQPFSYQWLFGDAPLSWATNAMLVLTNVQDRDAGRYSVMVSNAFAAVSSPEAAVTLRPRPTLGEAADADGLSWTNTGQAAWFGQTEVSHDGVDALKSGSLAHRRDATLSTTITGPGNLSFWWKLSPGADGRLRFLLNASVRAELNGFTSWQRVATAIPPGNHRAAWIYSVGISGESADEGAWLDEVTVWGPASPPVILSRPSPMTVLEGQAAQLEVVAGGGGTLRYQWMKEGVAVSGATNARYAIGQTALTHAGDYSVVVSNAFGSIISRTVALTVRPLATGLWEVGRWPDGGTPARARAVAVAGNYAYVAEGTNGLQVIDVSNPATPTRVGGYDTSGYAQGVQVVGSLAYVADGAAGLQIIDVSNPANPVRIGGYDTSGDAYAVQVAGSLAYVADGATGLQIIDVSNPANPVRVGAYVGGSASGVQVAGNLAYEATRGSLRIIDVSNPARPVRVSDYYALGAAGVHVAGNLAYMACGGAGLQIIDVGNPRPIGVGGYDTSGNAVAVQVVGSLVFVADGPAGVQVIDVGNPRPIRVGGYDTSGNALAVHVAGNLAFVADDTGGLVILEVQLPSRLQTITIAPVSDQVVTNAPFSLSAVASSQLPVAFSVVGGPATIAGNVVTLTGVGRAVVRAVQPGNAWFEPAMAEVAFEVRPASQPPVPPAFRNVRVPPDGTVEFDLEGEPGRTYRIETSTDLEQWDPMTSILATAALTLVQLTPEVASPHRFFRIRVVQGGEAPF